MTPSEGTLSSKSVYTGSTRVRFANGTLLPIAAIGDVSLPSCDRQLTLCNVCHVPSLKTQFIVCQTSLFLIMIVLLVLMLPLSLLRTEPRARFFYRDLA